MTNETMQAVLLEEYGGPLVLRDVPVPEPGPGEVLVRVRACAVDRFDTAIRAQVRERGELPLILGHEIAGEVVVPGSGVEGWSEGAIGSSPRCISPVGGPAGAGEDGRRSVRTSPATSGSTPRRLRPVHGVAGQEPRRHP